MRHRMGLGASHQTGWSGLVANLIDEWRRSPMVKAPFLRHQLLVVLIVVAMSGYRLLGGPGISFLQALYMVSSRWPAWAMERS